MLTTSGFLGVKPLYLRDFRCAFYKVKATFFKAIAAATAAELMGIIPITVPKLNPLEKTNVNIPGVGQIDIDNYDKAGKPILDQEGWWRLAYAVAQKDMSALPDVVDLAEKRLRQEDWQPMLLHGAPASQGPDLSSARARAAVWPEAGELPHDLAERRHEAQGPDLSSARARAAVWHKAGELPHDLAERRHEAGP